MPNPCPTPNYVDMASPHQYSTVDSSPVTTQAESTTQAMQVNEVSYEALASQPGEYDIFPPVHPEYFDPHNGSEGNVDGTDLYGEVTTPTIQYYEDMSGAKAPSVDA